MSYMRTLKRGVLAAQGKLPKHRKGSKNRYVPDIKPPPGIDMMRELIRDLANK